MFQINNIGFYLKKLEKEQTKPKEIRRNKIMIENNEI